MSEEIKERLEKLRREYRPSMAGDVCLSWAADVAPALSEALALITSLTAELTAARAEVARKDEALRAYMDVTTDAMKALLGRSNEELFIADRLHKAHDKARAAPTPAEEVEKGPNALADVAAERRRQVEVEGWTPEHDDEHEDGDLAKAASCYAWFAGLWDQARQNPSPGAPVRWPWDEAWWKPKDRRCDLVRAAALIVAEIERLDRATPAEEGERG